MSLRTAPCPTCQGTIVFGERKCRNCGMVFDYGPNAPPVPSEADVFDALLAVPSSTPQARPQPPQHQQQQQQQPPQQQQQPPQQRPPQQPPQQQRPSGPALMEGLDTGRFSAGDVEPEDIPGFVDSTLFKSMTPDHVESAAVPGLEVTRHATSHVHTQQSVEIDTGRANVGDVVPSAAVPGIYGADMFKTDVDFAAGAASAGDMLETTAIKVRDPAALKGKKGETFADINLPRVVCNSCGAAHSKPRCPACATPHPQARPGG